MTNESAPAQDSGLNWIVTKFIQEVPGTAHAVLVSADGLLMAASDRLPEDRAEQVAAVSSGLASVPLTPFPTYCATKAAIHSWTQSLRYQLRNTHVEVLELAPPYVQTELTGAHQTTDPNAMPLADYITETMSLLETPQPNGEVLVKRVHALRFAERRGTGRRRPRRRHGRCRRRRCPGRSSKRRARAP